MGQLCMHESQNSADFCSNHGIMMGSSAEEESDQTKLKLQTQKVELPCLVIQMVVLYACTCLVDRNVWKI